MTLPSLRSLLLVVLACVVGGAVTARADDLSTGILDERPSVFHVDSVRVRYTHFDQAGLGYQSQAGPYHGPGLEEASIEQPQVEVIAHQGSRITHRL